MDKSFIENYKLSQVNSKNFLELTKNYRKRFLLEIMFRSYYVNYFIESFVGKNYYSECNCYSLGTPHARVDNVIYINGKHVLFEVKLNIKLENNLIGQLKQYIDSEYMYLDSTRTIKIYNYEREYMYVIDTMALYKYDRKTDSIKKVIDLDFIKTQEDIFNIFNTK